MKSEIVKQKIAKIHSLFEQAESIFNEIDYKSENIIEEFNYTDCEIKHTITKNKIELYRILINEGLWKKLEKLENDKD